MAKIHLEGFAESFVITHLDRISIRSASSNTISYSGEIKGRMDSEEFSARSLSIDGRYLICGEYENVRGVEYPVYVSTLGTVLYYRGDHNFTLYSDDGAISATENVLVIHYADLRHVRSLLCSGSLKSVFDKPPQNDGKETKTLDGFIISRDWNGYMGHECNATFEGEVEYTKFLRGEIIDFDGRFKVKLLKGTAEREQGGPYKLRGDWEAVFEGYLHSEVGSVSIWREYRDNKGKIRARPTRSLVKVTADGELIR